MALAEEATRIGRAFRQPRSGRDGDPRPGTRARLPREGAGGHGAPGRGDGLGHRRRGELALHRGDLLQRPGRLSRSDGPGTSGRMERGGARVVRHVAAGCPVHRPVPHQSSSAGDPSRRVVGSRDRGPPRLRRSDDRPGRRGEGLLRDGGDPAPARQPRGRRASLRPCPRAGSRAAARARAPSPRPGEGGARAHGPPPRGRRRDAEPAAARAPAGRAGGDRDRGGRPGDREGGRRGPRDDRRGVRHAGVGRLGHDGTGSPGARRG